MMTGCGRPPPCVQLAAGMSSAAGSPNLPLADSGGSAPIGPDQYAWKRCRGFHRTCWMRMAIAVSAAGSRSRCCSPWVCCSPARSSWRARINGVMPWPRVCALNRLEEKVRQRTEVNYCSRRIRDPLTSLFNRRYLDETLREIHRALREQPLAVVMIDPITSSASTTSGGTRLATSCCSSRQALLDGPRASDIACRYGGEELLVVMHPAPMPARRCGGSAQSRRKRARGGRVMGREIEAITFSAVSRSFPDNGDRRRFWCAPPIARFTWPRASRTGSWLPIPPARRSSPPLRRLPAAGRRHMSAIASTDSRLSDPLTRNIYSNAEKVSTHDQHAGYPSDQRRNGRAKR